MIESLQSLPSILTLIGIILLAIEIAVLGFSTLFLVFVSVACFGTAVLMKFGVVPETPWAALISMGVQSALWALVLWKPLQKLQSQQQNINTQNSALDGECFHINGELAHGTPITQKYSGVQWEVLLEAGEDSPLNAGTEVIVTKADVGRLIVKAKSQ